MNHDGQKPELEPPDSIAHKIQDLLSVRDQIDEGSTVAHCHGVFDLIHPGHLRHLNEAKEMADVLVVTVTPDEYIDKGPNRPVFTESLRAESLASLDFVDYVAINEGPKAIPAIQAIEPDFYVKGPDYEDPDEDITGGIVEEREAVEAVGGRLETTSDITFSSSNLINNHLPVLPDRAQEYLQGFRTRYSSNDVIEYLENAGEMSVLLVGETILDQYTYVDSIGKSTKDPVLVTQYKEDELYAGGILAIANHLAPFCGEVRVVTMIGEDKRQEAFIRENLHENVEPIFIRTSEAPTILKRRFVDDYLNQKLFGVYEIDKDAITRGERETFHSTLEDQAGAHDVVLVADYGHGLMDEKAVKIVDQESPFLAVNTQSNADNRGFNTISKYPSPDWFCLASHEVALEAQDRNGDYGSQLREIANSLDCERAMVTRGKQGTTAWSSESGLTHAPALAHKVVDRIGAGDAVFGLTTLAVAQGAPMNLVAFLGNAVGAQAVQIVGNDEHIERMPLFKHVETLLK